MAVKGTTCPCFEVLQYRIPLSRLSLEFCVSLFPQIGSKLSPLKEEQCLLECNFYAWLGTGGARHWRQARAGKFSSLTMSGQLTLMIWEENLGALKASSAFPWQLGGQNV